MACPTDSILLSEEQIRQRVDELGREITRDYTGLELVLVTALKGAIVFCADLMRRIDLPVRLEFICAASYGDDTQSSGQVCLELGLCGELSGRHVLVVEDIVDTGRTLSALLEELSRRGPASLRSCCLLDKPTRREVHVRADYVGFEIPDHFVVGYGLDFAGQFRNLPYVGILDR